MKVNKIYVVNDSGHEYESGLKNSNINFDEIIFITSGMLDLYNLDRLATDMIGIVDTIEDNDAIILNGPIIINFVLGVLLNVMEKQNIHILLYVPGMKVYRVRRMDYAVRTKSDKY